MTIRKRPKPQWLFTILDHLMLSRPMILIPVWLFVLLGSWHGSDAVYQPVWIPSLSVIGAFLNFTLLLSAVYIHNQIVDRKSDLLNQKLFLISEGIIPLRRAIWLCVILYLFPVGLSLFWGWFHFSLFALSALLGVAYSARPLHFKGRPFLDVISNGVGNGVLNVLIGYSAAGATFSYDMLGWLTVPYALAVGAVFTSTAIPDIEGDRAEGEHGTAVILGERGAAWLALILMLLAMVTAIYWQNMPCMLGTIISLPGFLWSAIQPNRKTHIIAYQVSTMVFALIAGMAYLIFIPYLVLVIMVTRWYYKKRFSLRYPF